MPEFLLYCLKAGGCLVAFYLFYKLLLGRDTLHRMNRLLLCGMFVLSYLLPLCVLTVERELPRSFGAEAGSEGAAQAMLPFLFVPEMPETVVVRSEMPPAPIGEPFDWQGLLRGIYLAGVLAVFGRMLWNTAAVVGIIRCGRRRKLADGGVLVLDDRVRAPFSWMKYAVMSEEDYLRNAGTILLHEQAHIRLGHSWDLLAVDLAGCLQWFNPAVWLLRRELRAVHEYEADEAVLRAGVDVRDYQMLLIKKAVGGRWCSIANSLNHSNLKSRITMMLRKRSSRWAGAKCLYVLPLVCVALGAFAQTVYVSPGDESTKNSGNGEIERATVAPAGVSSPGVPSDVLSSDETDCVMELLANLERAAREAQTAAPVAHTLCGRVFGENDRPWAGFEFLCSGGRRVVTDAEGRFSITSEVPVQLYYFDREGGSSSSRPVLNRYDVQVEFHTARGMEIRYERRSGDPVVYTATGDPEDYRFERDRLPMLLYGNRELSPAVLRELISCPEKLEIRGRRIEDSEMIARYGPKSANGIVYLDVQGNTTQSWTKADDVPWSPDRSELHLRWQGDEASDELLAAIERSEQMWMDQVIKIIGENPAFAGFGSLTELEEGQVYRLTIDEKHDRNPFLSPWAYERLWFLDGEEVSLEEFFSKYPRQVGSIVVMRSAAAMRKYGRRGRMGAVEATTRPPSPQNGGRTERHESDPMSYIEGDLVPVDGGNTYAATQIDRCLGPGSDWERIPLVLVDERVADIYVFPLSAADGLAGVQIIDKPDAETVARYGTAARNGIIKVTTRAALRTDDTEETIYDRSNHPLRYLRGKFRSIDGRNTYRVKGGLQARNVRRTHPDRLPVVTVDGRCVFIADVENIPSRRLLWVRIFSPDEVTDEMTARYGRRAGSNGVVEVWTLDGLKDGAIEMLPSDSAAHGATFRRFPANAAGREDAHSADGAPVVSVSPGAQRASGMRLPVSDTVRSVRVSDNTAPLSDGSDAIGLSFDEPEREGEPCTPSDGASLSIESRDMGRMLVLLDGKEATSAELRALNPDQIAAVSVRKDRSLTERYGERAAEGVVYVTTKSGEREFRRLECSFDGADARHQGAGVYRIEPAGRRFAIRPSDGAAPVVTVDGRIVGTACLESIGPDTVEWVKIVQPSVELLDLYGEQARDGAIEFITKKR